MHVIHCQRQRGRPGIKVTNALFNRRGIPIPTIYPFRSRALQSCARSQSWHAFCLARVRLLTLQSIPLRQQARSIRPSIRPTLSGSSTLVHVQAARKQDATRAPGAVQHSNMSNERLRLTACVKGREATIVLTPDWALSRWQRHGQARPSLAMVVLKRSSK